MAGSSLRTSFVNAVKMISVEGSLPLLMYSGTEAWTNSNLVNAKVTTLVVWESSDLGADTQLSLSLSLTRLSDSDQALPSGSEQMPTSAGLGVSRPSDVSAGGNNGSLTQTAVGARPAVPGLARSSADSAAAVARDSVETIYKG